MDMHQQLDHTHFGDHTLVGGAYSQTQTQETQQEISRGDGDEVGLRVTTVVIIRCSTIERRVGIRGSGVERGEGGMGWRGEGVGG